MRTTTTRASVCGLLLGLSATLVPAQPAAGQAGATAYDRVLALFDDAPVVFLGERHWSRQDSDFRKRLVQHPGFSKRVDDVVIEFANARYQNLLDAYFLELKNVPLEQLRDVWRNTTQTSGVWDSPVYQEFLKTLRRVNERLPADARVRVVAGGPPIDWSQVQTYEDKLPFAQRGWHGVRQIERNVLAKNRRALVIYGYGHALRAYDDMDEDDNMLRRLEALHPDVGFRVVVPMPGTGRNDFATGVARAAPVYLDAHAEPHAGMRAADHVSGAAGLLKEAADGLLDFGGRADETIRPDQTLYEDDPSYRAEIERRRSLRPRLPMKSYR